ncbi:hypothetical protein CPC08DRAFT_820242 [Agrocybe pediades]|nr:hypothetical protein CPC08DRAFT_820242 [Agrocybe pediades]
MNNQVADLQALAENIAATETDMVSLAEYIASANERLEALLVRKYQLCDTYNSATDVMLRLPLEIVTRIFSLAIDYEPGDMPPQLVMGQVCRNWQEIVWSTPTLWKDLRILLVKDRFKQQEQLIREWIDRTAQCTLLIHIVVDDGTANTNRRRGWDPPVRFYRHLLETCYRWESFELDSSSTNFQGLLDTGAYHFPQLKHIKLFGTSQPPTMSDFRQYEDIWELNQPPQLESISITSFAYAGMNIDWSSIKQFSADMLFLPAVRIINMCSAHALTGLDLRLSMEGTESQEMDDMAFNFVCPNLRVLMLAGLADVIAAMLDTLTVPALAELTLFVDGQPDGAFYDWDTALLEMAKRSNFRISVMKLRQFETAIDDNQLLDILSAMPSLEKLIMRNPPGFPLSDAILRPLALPGGPFREGDLSEMEAQRTREESLLALKSFFYWGPINISLSILEGVMISRSRARARSETTQRQGTTDYAPPKEPFDVCILYQNDDWAELDRYNVPDRIHRINELPGVDLCMNLYLDD